MADSVLCFPSLRPPENEWFTRVLLYRDQVGTILPQGTTPQPDFAWRRWPFGLWPHVGGWLPRLSTDLALSALDYAIPSRDVLDGH
jgi:hypothetical protein